MSFLTKAMAQAAAGNAGAEADEYFNQTTLLLHGDGTNGAQNNTFLDSSSNTFTITRNGNTTQGTFSPFSSENGKWSVYIGGVDDWVDIVDSGALLGSGAWTMEGWFYPTTTGANRQLFDFRYPDGYSPDDNMAVIFSSANAVEYWNGSTRISGGTVQPNQWNHVLCSRDSSNDVRLFLNGVQVGSTYNDTTAYDSIVCRIGCANTGGDFQGFVSNVRLVNGTAVETSGFTVPTSPLTEVSGTTFLGLQSNRFVDNSTTPVTSVTPNDAVSIQPFSPFAPSAAYSASVNGGSGYWDGTDTLTVSSTGLTFTGDFTVEAWIYSSFTGGTGLSGFTIIDTRAGYTLSNWALGVFDSVGTLYWVSTGILPASSITCNPNAWNHVLVSRSGTTLRIFVNGQQGYSGTVSGTITPGSATAYIGTGTGGTNYAAPGYISGLSVIDGTATQTSNFTPPTAPPNPTGTELCLLMQNAGVIDSTAKNNIETVGNAQVDTSVVKYGTGSLKFDGSGDVLYIPYSNTFSFGTGDFTVEFWINKNNSNDGFIMTCGESTSVGNWCLLFYAGNLYWQSQYNVANLYLRSASSILDGNWHHVAITRSSGVQRMFFDGVIQGSTVADTTNYVVASGTKIAIGLSNLSGYLDDFRITKGVARYTSNFTVPDKAFPDQ